MIENQFSGFTSFIDVLEKHKEERPDEIAYRFLRNGEEETGSLTYRSLYDAVSGLAARLQEEGFEGERALLLYHSGLDYVIAMLACFSAGVIAIPAYPPRNARKLPRIEVMVADSEAALVLTTSSISRSLEEGRVGGLARARWLETDTLPKSSGRWRRPELSRDAVAYLQYTSGSTSSPKGVIVTHGNLIHNAASICRQFAQTSSSRFVSWLPLFHDLGLIYGVLVPLYAGAECTLMSPAAFLQHPFRWLKAISDYRATTSGAPNFAYELCARRITEKARSELDLRPWRIALNGAEPVRASTLEEFTRAFVECGFRPEIHKPSYGLAEATLVVSCTPAESTARLLVVDPDVLEATGEAVTPSGGQDRSRTLVASGRVFDDQTVLIVDPGNSRAVPDGRIGEVWVNGPSVAHGYWRRPEETEAVFGATCVDAPGRRFLRTGDLAFFDGGNLFIAGRLKDVIVLRGRNLYPQDIESVVEGCHESLRMAGTAAFSIDKDGGEALVVVSEVEHRSTHSPSEIVDAIREAVGENFDVAVTAVELIKAGSLPKTSSGKVQRQRTRALFQSQYFSSIHRWERVGALEDALPEDAGLEGVLKKELTRLLGFEPSAFDSRKPLTATGLDSLAAATLAEFIEREVGVRYPIGGLFGGTTLESLVSDLSAEVEHALLRAAQGGG